MKSGFLKKIFWVFVLVSILSFFAIIFSNWRVNKSTELQVYSEIESLPELKVGMVLGTSKYIRNGQINQYFKNRIDAAAKLYHAGKIKYILVSGDNGQVSYNEPRQMLQELIKKGVPEEAIVLDFAGFRTFDSVVRAKEVFGQDSMIVISQKFQNQRAIFIGNHKEIAIFGYNAKDVNKYYGFRTRIREHLARVKLMLDIFILQTQPKFLGEKEDIGTFMQE
jgi:SanA protein